jgi:hypothetical protein
MKKNKMNAFAQTNDNGNYEQQVMRQDMVKM